MDRKRFILIVAACFLLTAAVLTYISLTGNETAAGGENPAKQPSVSQETGDGTTAQKEADSSAAAPMETGTPQTLKSESVEVTGNSPEYDLKAQLCEDLNKRTFLRLEYYIDGAGTVMEADDSKIPELTGIFEKREEAGTAADSCKIAAAYFNPVLSKLYVQISGKSSEGFADTAIYSLDLKMTSVKKLFSFPGKYSGMSFNKDFSLLAFSFADLPAMSNYQENSMFSIIDCKTDEFRISASRSKDGKTAGKRDPAYLYDYVFLSWKSSASVLLKQTVYSIKDVDGKPVAEGEIAYDITRDEFTNSDGSPLTSAVQTTASDPAAGVKGGSGAVKVLTDFYSLLPSESNYKKAMDLLDDSFKLQLELLTQFGQTEIVKSDIDEEGVSMFSELLKAAKLDSIVKVELTGGVYKIYYYQTLALNEDSQVRQALTAQIQKVKGKYRIVLIKDADEEKPPFK